MSCLFDVLYCTVLLESVLITQPWVLHMATLVGARMSVLHTPPTSSPISAMGVCIGLRWQC